jgi:multidrug efflux pump subunit AcrB
LRGHSGRSYHGQLYSSNFSVIQLKDALASMAGVGNGTIFAQQDYTMRLWLDPDKMLARNLTLRASVPTHRRSIARSPVRGYRSSFDMRVESTLSQEGGGHSLSGSEPPRDREPGSSEASARDAS